MNQSFPAANISKVIITGGRETGGLESFASTLADGFRQLNLAAEVIPPSRIYQRPRDLRDPAVLKILSTTAVFAAPFSRRAVCVAHGFPRPDAQGWSKVLALLASFRMAASSGCTPLVAVSFYTATHLKAIYNIQASAVIHNPLNQLFFSAPEEPAERPYLTYVGRLHPVKNAHRLLPAMKQFLDESPGMRVCVVGDGSLRPALERQFGSDPRVEFAGSLGPSEVRDVLRKTRVFLSGAETESFGIAYLEALSQGCAVVMPACGGGLEIAPELIGSKVQTVPLSFNGEAIMAAIRRASACVESSVSPAPYAPERIAGQYLQVAAMAR